MDINKVLSHKEGNCQECEDVDTLDSLIKVDDKYICKDCLVTNHFDIVLEDYKEEMVTNKSNTDNSNKNKIGVWVLG